QRLPPERPPRRPQAADQRALRLEVDRREGVCAVRIAAFVELNEFWLNRGIQRPSQPHRRTADSVRLDEALVGQRCWLCPTSRKTPAPDQPRRSKRALNSRRVFYPRQSFLSQRLPETLLRDRCRQQKRSLAMASWFSCLR